MSNSLAIAAVTATLRDILNTVAQRLPFDPDPDPELNDATCTTKPPDKARPNESANQLNLFLYQTAIHPNLRNDDIAGQVRPGESAMPPLPLKLEYVLTAYGKGNDEILSHRLLGRAMSLLHDRSVLLPSDIEKALKGNDLYRQIERVRLTPHPLSTEELSKLWAVFQAPYRVSATYEASVVLIDSARRTRAPLPVLSRGVGSVPATTPAFPTIDHIDLAFPDQAAARLASGAIAGDVVTLAGHDFTGTALTIALSHRLLATPRTLPPTTATPTALTLGLPDEQAALPAGLYAVTVIASQGADPDKALVSNQATLAIAPRILTIAPAPAVRDAQGKVTVTVTVSPQIWLAQRASLIVGDAEFVAAPRTAQTDPLVFTLGNLPAGAHPPYAVRVRVDGVDSLVIDYAADPIAFDPTQTLEVT